MLNWGQPPLFNISSVELGPAPHFQHSIGLQDTHHAIDGPQGCKNLLRLQASKVANSALAFETTRGTASVFGANEPASRLNLQAVMSRGQRIYVPNGIYHAMSRGNRKLLIFEDARDRRRFVMLVAEAAERYGVEVFAECRMGTHYHLIVRTPRANISEFMNYLNGEYAKYSNRRHERSGHLFGERFKPILVDTGLYLRVVLSYVMNNPVASRQVTTPEQWKWSSYRATIGIDVPPPYLQLDWLEATFPSASLAGSQGLFARYVNSPTVEEAEIMLHQDVVGSDPFRLRIRALIAARLYTASVPRAYRALHRPPLNELLPFGLAKAERNTAMLRAHAIYAYSEAEIARYLGFHTASVSRIICSIRPRCN